MTKRDLLRLSDSQIAIDETARRMLLEMEREEREKAEKVPLVRLGQGEYTRDYNG